MIQIKVTNELHEDTRFNLMEVQDKEHNEHAGSSNPITCKGDVIVLNVNGIQLGIEATDGHINIFNYGSTEHELLLQDSVSSTVQVDVLTQEQMQDYYNAMYGTDEDYEGTTLEDLTGVPTARY